MIKIKSNKELFEEWKHLSKKIEALNSIVQNTVTVDSEEYYNWKKLFDEVYEELYELRDATCGYITVDCEWTEGL